MDIDHSSWRNRAQGRIQADGSWQTLDAPTLPHGIYLLTVSDGQRTRTAKLVAH